MYELYDKASPITWPSGRTMTAEELRAHPRYRMLFDFDSVLDVDEDGVATSYFRLADLKGRLGVSEGDPRAAVDALNAARDASAPPEEAADIADLAAQVAEQGAAIEGMLAVLAEGYDG